MAEASPPSTPRRTHKDLSALHVALIVQCIFLLLFLNNKRWANRNLESQVKSYSQTQKCNRGDYFSIARTSTLVDWCQQQKASHSQSGLRPQLARWMRRSKTPCPGRCGHEYISGKKACHGLTRGWTSTHQIPKANNNKRKEKQGGKTKSKTV